MISFAGEAPAATRVTQIDGFFTAAVSYLMVRSHLIYPVRVFADRT
jgi:hypothetical protein